VAGLSGGMGVSNCGGISVNVHCLTWSSDYNSTASGIKLVSNLNSCVLNNCVKSRGRSSLSWRHERNPTASEPMSGTLITSPISLSSLRVQSMSWFSSLMSQLMMVSCSFPLSSFSSHSSSMSLQQPVTHSLPRLDLGVYMAINGRFSGYDVGPLVNTGNDGFCTDNVHPYGYTTFRLFTFSSSLSICVPSILGLSPLHKRNKSEFMIPCDIRHSLG
jgi:hypothetical protein